MILRLVIAGALSIPAQAAFAEQTTEALVTVLAGHDCSISQPQVAGVFGPLGFTPEFVQSTLVDWIVEGVASEDARGVLSLPSTICPPESPAATPYQQVLDRFRDQDCKMGADEIPAVLADLGMSEAQLSAIAKPMVESGSIKIARSVATLQAPLCGAKD